VLFQQRTEPVKFLRIIGERLIAIELTGGDFA